jgi:predicted TIM-barrel enzyme
MQDFMIWRREHPSSTPPQPGLEDRILYTPPVEPVGRLPYELAGLLPNRDHNRDLMALVDGLPKNQIGDRAVVGVFAADPFLNCKQFASHLAAKGYNRVANIPPVAGYGAEFLATLDKVRSGRVREQRTMELLAGLGLTVCPAVVSVDCLPSALSVTPPLLWIAPGFDMWKGESVNPDALLALCREVAVRTDAPLILMAAETGISPKAARRAGAQGMLID